MPASPPADDRLTDIRVVYQEVCNSLHVIDDFRARLLALLPLSSGAGIFLLLETSDGSRLGAIGLIGCFISVGLFVYELRGMAVCRHLEHVAERLEKDMKLEAEGDDRPARGQFVDWAPRGIPWVPPRVWQASLIVYVTVIVGWAYLAYVGFMAES